MVRKILAILCMAGMVLAFTPGALVAGVPYAAQTTTEDIISTLEDPVDSSLAIDITSVLIVTNPNSLVIAVQLQKAINETHLDSNHQQFYLGLDTDKNQDTGNGGCEYMVMIGYDDINKCYALSIFDKDYNEVHNQKDNVGINTDNKAILAEVPISKIGGATKFNWAMTVDGLIGRGDTVPNNGFTSHPYENPTSGSGSGSGSGTGSGSGSGSGTNNTGSNGGTGTNTGGTSGTGSNQGSNSGDTGSTAKFSDVKSSDWYYQYVMTLVDTEVVNGYSDGTFKPQKNITRAEFCKIVLAAIKQKPLSSTKSSFSDCASHWAKGYIEKAKSLGITDGYKDANGSLCFKPDALITRAEICKMISVAADFDLSRSGSGFTDCKDHWADKYIATARGNKVVSGYIDGTFKPGAYATRAEVCKMVYEMIK